MTYKIKVGAPINFPPLPEIPSVPKWVVDALPKDKRCNIHYDNGVWKIDGKVVKKQGGTK